MVSQNAYEFFIQCLKKLGVVEPALAISLKPFLQEYPAKRTAPLLFKGSVHSKILFMISGSAREVTQHPMTCKEETSWMWFKGDFIYTKPGFFSQQIAQNRVEAMEDCNLLSIQYDDFVSLDLQYPNLHRLSELIRDQHYQSLKRHALDLAALSNQQRYDLFIQAHPKALFQFNHRFIASFLGIRDKGLDRYSGKR